MVVSVPSTLVSASVSAVNAGADLLQEGGQNVVNVLDQIRSSVSSIASVGTSNSMVNTRGNWFMN